MSADMPRCATGPHNSLCLKDVGVPVDADRKQNCAFYTPELMARVAQFKQALQALDARPSQDGDSHLVPLAGIASCILY